MISDDRRRLRRRLALLCVSFLVLSACATDGAAPSASESASAPSSEDEPEQPQHDDPTDEPTSPPPPDETDPDTDDRPDGPAVEDVAPAPDPEEPYVLSADEMLPDAKRVASDVVQELLTYDAGTVTVDALDAVAGKRGVGGQLADDAAPVLHDEAWSRGRIVYPQLGGFTDTDVSVMVVAVQTIGRPGGEVVEESRTFDVRLVREDGEWAFDRLASAGGVPVPRPDDLSEAAAAVLDDERIELPDSARWDIHRGAVQPTLLRLLSHLAERTPFGVVVFETGHPWEVFGTDRQSRHSLGRAVDVHRVGASHVIDDRHDESETRAVVGWLYDQSLLNNIGAPWALDGYGGRSFTDDLHQDHLHIESVPDGPPENG